MGVKHLNYSRMMPSFTQMLACLMLLVALFQKGRPSRTRDYYIAAVEKDWNYAPTGLNNVKGIPLVNDRRVFCI